MSMKRILPRVHERVEPGQRGAVAVEFALVMVPFIALLLGTLQFAWYFFGAQSASAAAREGARQVVVGNCWGASFATYVKGQSSLVKTATYSPTDLTSAGVSVGSKVTVTVVADAGIIHLFPLPGEVTRTFEARLEDKSPGDGTC
jgi:Flp pilus assembly protein TadG